MKMPLELYGDLFYIPYRKNGRTMDGLDCVGVFVTLQRRLGRDVPFYGSTETGLDVALGQWVKVDDPKIGDGILFFSDDPPWHVGTVIGPNLFLHGKEGAGVVVERYDSPAYARRIEGFYRWKA